MRIYLLSIFLLFGINFTYAQFRVSILSDKLHVEMPGEEIKKGVIIIKYQENGTEEKTTISWKSMCQADKEKIFPDATSGGVTYRINCKENRVKIFIAGQEEKTARDFYYCPKKETFVQEKKDCPETTYKDITKIPIPIFKYENSDIFPDNPAHRYLFIDAHPDLRRKKNNTLYKRKKDATISTSNDYREFFTKTKVLPINASLSVFIRHYNFSGIRHISVQVSGEDYVYNKDLSALLESVKPKKTGNAEDVGGSDIEATADDDQDSLESQTVLYLKAALSNLDSAKFLNIKDIYILETYKEGIRTTMENNETDLTYKAHRLLDSLLSWQPTYVFLTPISLSIPEKDEVEVKISIRSEGEETPQTQTVGRYKTSGGLAIDVGAMMYLTDLKNNEVYTQTENGGLFAKMNEEDQNSIGIGVNSEISFRTGALLRPTINVGFFIPFDEDLSPFITLGPGLSIGGSKAKFSLSAGYAYGKVNVIAERHRDMDLINVPNLTNESLAEKVWQSGWYIGIGVRYNFEEK